MQLTNTAIHHIDHTKDCSRSINISSQEKILKEYVEKLIYSITNSSKKRSYNFSSYTSELYSALKLMLNNNFDKGAATSANRLHRIEKITQKKYSNLKNEIPKGSLFQALLKNDKSKKIIISKAEHNSFLDEEDFTIHQGLPWDKQIYKAVIIDFDKNNNDVSIYVYDTNRTIAQYWWQDFLELKLKYTDSHNTVTALESIDRKVFIKIKDKYPADHTILRNSMIGYFRNQEEFDLYNFIENTLDSYHPVDKNLPIEFIKEKVLELPRKWDFDARFSIEKKEISKKSFNKICLSDEIELVLKDHINNLRDIVTTEEDGEGNKYIKIKTENGYKHFR